MGYCGTCRRQSNSRSASAEKRTCCKEAQQSRTQRSNVDTKVHARNCLHRIAYLFLKAFVQERQGDKARALPSPRPLRRRFMTFSTSPRLSVPPHPRNSQHLSSLQFIDHITGNHVGFPESELTTLFDFFRSPTRGVGASTSRPPSRTSPKDISRNGSGRGRGSGGGAEGSAAQQQGADWTVAVACLRLLVKPKEPVMASVLGVFDVFARARGDRTRHERRLEQERLETVRQELLAEERERWKRRRRRERERGVAPSAQVSGERPFLLPGTSFLCHLTSCRRKAE